MAAEKSLSARSLAASLAGRSVQRDGVAARMEEVFVKSKPWPFTVCKIHC